MGGQLSGTVSLDGNNNPLVFPCTDLYEDGAGVGQQLAITNVSLTSNVVTATWTDPLTFKPFIGQKVTIAGCGAIYNGAFTITGIDYSAKTFTYAKTHADDGGGAVTGTSTPSPTDSPVGTGASDEIMLVAPPNACELEVYASAVFTARKVSGGATKGTWSIQATSVPYIKIACQPGDLIFIFRTNSGTLNFRFRALK